MYCSFPDLNWARLQVYADGSAQTFDCDGVKHNFENEEEAEYFLAEDEYTELDKLDTEDEQEIGIPLSSIEIPQGDTEEDGEYNALFSIESLEIIEGDLPNRAEKLVVEWATLYQKELLHIWNSQEFNKLPPLK